MAEICRPDSVRRALRFPPEVTSVLAPHYYAPKHFAKVTLINHRAIMLFGSHVLILLILQVCTKIIYVITYIVNVVFIIYGIPFYYLLVVCKVECHSLLAMELEVKYGKSYQWTSE